MPSVVNDSCVLCRSCIEVCPVDAFHEGEGASMVVISPDDCIDCGVCLAECPQGAITTAEDADAKWVAFNAEKAAEWPVAQK